MGKKTWQIAVMYFLIVCVPMLYAQNLLGKEYKSTRWRLKFENSDPKSITITEPNGEKKVYWYIQYKVMNNTEREIPWMLHIRMVIDKAKEGVQESKVPGLFYEAKLPDENKEEYLNNLQSYYDTDFPVVRKEILRHLKLYPELSANDKAILSALSTTQPKDIMDIMKDCGLSYIQIEQRLNDLVVQNLAISQEIIGKSLFMGAKGKHALFLVHDQESSVKVGETINGWELVSFSHDKAIIKKNDILKTLAKGTAVDYLYLKTDKILMERDSPIVSGVSARGSYKGLMDEQSGKTYHFKKASIAPKSVVHGLAIFSNVSREMDFMGIVVSGLVDPIAKKNKKTYLENLVLISAYKKPGDSYGNDVSPVTPLYRREVILNSKEVKQK
ncbi:MAG: hypothetical protein HUU50_06050 [Candidatus Brocadiae bacterium]|nr:hypothetical protein [Candidatus Brocadiia bacterium]